MPTPATSYADYTAVPRRPSGAFYASREAFRSMLDFKESARNDAQVDLALSSATAQVEKLLHRSFFPWFGSRYFDWPPLGPSTPWRLWLDEDEIVSIAALTAGGVTVPSSDYVLYPNSGPPYSRVEIDLSSQSAFTSGSTYQDAIAITGVFGYSAEAAPVGRITADVADGDTTIPVSSSAGIGVGDVLRIDYEYMVVTARSQVSTGQTLQTPLTAMNSNVGVVVTDGTGFTVGETLLLDSERVQVVDIAGNTLTVRRAAEGSVLAVHTGSTIYAARSLTVARAALAQVQAPYPGEIYPAEDLYPSSSDTSATGHLNGSVVSRHIVPGAVVALTLAEAARTFMSNASGWSSSGGGGSSAPIGQPLLTALGDLRTQAITAHGRRGRIRAV